MRPGARRRVPVGAPLAAGRCAANCVWGNSGPPETTPSRGWERESAGVCPSGGDGVDGFVMKKQAGVRPGSVQVAD